VTQPPAPLARRWFGREGPFVGTTVLWTTVLTSWELRRHPQIIRAQLPQLKFSGKGSWVLETGHGHVTRGCRAYGMCATSVPVRMRMYIDRQY
jgi:hypothetical protein